MFKVIIWPDREKVPLWSPRAGGFEAGDLVRWGVCEFVCVNTHRNPILPPDKGFLWAEVAR